MSIWPSRALLFETNGVGLLCLTAVSVRARGRQCFCGERGDLLWMLGCSIRHAIGPRTWCQPEELPIALEATSASSADTMRLQSSVERPGQDKLWPSMFSLISLMHSTLVHSIIVGLWEMLAWYAEVRKEASEQ